MEDLSRPTSSSLPGVNYDVESDDLWSTIIGSKLSSDDSMPDPLLSIQNWPRFTGLVGLEWSARQSSCL